MSINLLMLIAGPLALPYGDLQRGRQRGWAGKSGQRSHSLPPGPGLVLCPPGLKQETLREGVGLGSCLFPVYLILLPSNFALFLSVPLLARAMPESVEGRRRL